MKPFSKPLLLVMMTLALASAAGAAAGPPAPSGPSTHARQRLAQAETGSIHGTIQARRARDLANTLVFLEEVPGAFSPPAEPAHMDQINQQFDPFVLPVVQGTAVRFLNSDNTGHNVFTPDGETYDLGTWGQGESRDHTFTERGVYTQLCQLHPSMVSYVVVLQNPFFAVADEAGAFEIAGIPPGTYALAVWNERKEAEPQTVTVTAGGTTEVALELH